jgi:DNA-binding response OmpR family regulator
VNPIATNPLFPDDDTLIPRFREAGDVTLDLFHRDGRVMDRWLGLHPREFELLWRLAQQPGERMTRRQLLADVWCITFEPETNSLAAHVARVRAKLEPFGLARILATHPEGGYFLDVPPDPRLRPGFADAKPCGAGA